jgi:hypothetical protein
MALQTPLNRIVDNKHSTGKHFHGVIVEGEVDGCDGADVRGQDASYSIIHAILQRLSPFDMRINTKAVTK